LSDDNAKKKLNRSSTHRGYANTRSNSTAA
jgi:hypothetical protein